MKKTYEELWDNFVPSGEDSGRTQYEKDYDRVVFSQSFRRLAGKTQVHPFAHNDHVHTRLSHSLEVSIVGRSIVRELEKRNIIPNNKLLDCIEIVKTAGIAHDMGNPPFGHIGEDAIGLWVKTNKDKLIELGISEEVAESYSSYDGNAQNFHIFNTCEYFENKQLSDATAAALVKYPWVSSKNAQKAGYFKVDEDKFKKCFEALGLMKDGSFFRHPISYVMEAADDICYSMMDVDDAYEMGICGNTKSIENLLAKLNLRSSDETNNVFEVIRNKRGDILEKVIGEVAETFEKSMDYIMNGNVSRFRDGKIPLEKKDLIAMGKKDDNYLGLIAELKKYAADNVFGQRDKVVYETACYSIVETILNAWYEAYSNARTLQFQIEKLPNKSKKVLKLMNISHLEQGDKALSQIVDYVSGMTDRYAKFTADTLSGRLST